MPPVSAACPTDDVLAAHLAGELDRAAAAVVADHLDGCAACRAVVVAAVRGRVGAATDPDVTATVAEHAPSAGGALGPGTQIGRYVIGRLLGAGGMGMVYAAHDTALDRPVALKLLRGTGAGLVAMAERLARESRLMARVRHPAVLTVYDAGRDGARVYLAMERIDGGTLTAWLAARPRSWRAILAVFRRAGTGLAAAHAAGLVHRDFKPDNVLVEAGDPPARVLVTDFGVARIVGGDASIDPAQVGAAPPDARLTSTGVAVGTPAYMAPEQLAAGEVDARADVFGFAVALWEALSGSRPFAGRTLVELRAAIAGGPVAGARAFPSWIARALRGALIADPARRTATMAALLAALDPAPRRRRAGLAVALVGAAAIAGTTAVATSRADPPDSCRAGGDAIAALWTPAARARAVAAIGTGPDADLAPQIAAAIDGRVAAVRAGLDEVCAQDPATTPDHAARLTCLDARRLEATALIEALTAADPAAIAVAAPATAAVEDPALCRQAHPARLQALVPSDPAQRRVVTQLRHRMLAVDGLRIAGRFAEASAAAEALDGPVRATGFAPLVAEVVYLRASLAHVARDSAHAAELLREAARTAERAQHDYIAAAAWIQLAEQAALDLGDLGGARDDALQAQAALDRMGGDPILAVQLDQVRVMILLAERRYDDARRLIDAALPRALRDDPDNAAGLVVVLGAALEDAGQLAAALATYRALLAAPATSDNDPVARVGIRARLAAVYLERGQGALGIVAAGITRASAATLFAADHGDRLADELLWADALVVAGDGRGALALADAVGAAATRVFDDHNPLVAEALETGADALELLGRPAEAATRGARACEILSFTGGTDSVDAAECRLARLFGHELTPAAAVAALPGVAADVDRLAGGLGPDHARTQIARGLHGAVLLAAGRVTEARAELAAAIAAVPTGAVEPGLIAELELAMARADRAAGAPPAEVRAWVRRAVARFGIATPRWARSAAQARRLLPRP
jgi:tetratricopeptide (TPR) repeat protein